MPRQIVGLVLAVLILASLFGGRSLVANVADGPQHVVKPGETLSEIAAQYGLTVDQLEKLIGRRDYRLFLNSRNELYRERDMKRRPPPRDEALRLMAEHPNLIKRPIVVDGGAIALGFNEEELEKLL